MAGKKMSRASFSMSRGGVDEFDEVLTSPGNGEPRFCPRGITTIFASIDVTDGEGYIEYTNSNVADVQADTAIWKKWAKGNIFAYDDDYMFPCTAIRQVNVSGTTHFFGGAR